MLTTDLLRALVKREAEPWAGWWGREVDQAREDETPQKPAMDLARHLKPFEVQSKTLRVGERTAKLPEVIGALETAKARAWARLTAPPAVAPSPSHGDSTVDVDEAARLLGMSRSWVYRHAGRLPFARRVGRRSLRFSTSGIRRYLGSRGGLISSGTNGGPLPHATSDATARAPSGVH